MNLQETKEQLVAKKGKAEELRFELETKQGEELQSFIKTALKGILEEDTITGREEYFQLNRKREDLKHEKEILSLNFMRTYEKDEVGSKSIRLNYYTTWCEESFEQDRLITLGLVAAELKKKNIFQIDYDELF